MTWFTRLTGIHNETPRNVYAALSMDGVWLSSSLNDGRWRAGDLSLPALGELRAGRPEAEGRLVVRKIVADVQDLHLDPANAGALFQVASQFNLLEMVGPDVGPEEGISDYEFDDTQGPACAIACGAATVYRNYFVPVAGGSGQDRARQIDCLAGLGSALGAGPFWRMRNGYALPVDGGLARINSILGAMTEAQRDALRGALRVGFQQGCEVTLDGAGHLVSQVFCSAMPVAYCDAPAQDWEAIARLVLEAAYEATLLLALQNGDRRVFLTSLGGGAFGNEPHWIAAAIARALAIHRHYDLEVTLVSHGQQSPIHAQALALFKSEERPEEGDDG